jgi:alkylation response protein AidB-like acyl-CoA dehydrogenase
MNFDLPPEVAALAAEAREFADSITATLDQREDSWITGFDREVSRELGRRGWIGMTWPREAGGHGRPALERHVVVETLITAGVPIAASWFADRQIGPTLIAFGTDEQRARYLPEIMAGEALWCLGMSEPGAGSDLAGIGTRAQRDGDEFVVNGQKIWTSFAAKADYCYLIARTDPDAPPHKGMSEFIVPMDTAGITVRPILDMTHNDHFCEVWFDDVRVPAANLVGEQNGSWRQVMRQLEHERGGIDRLVSNRRLFQDVLARCDRSDPCLRQQAADIESRFRIGRMLVLREVLGQAPPSFSAATKVFCTDVEQRVADFAAAALGAEAVLWGRVARAVCYAPAYTIQGGTSTILRNIVGERVLGLPK